MWRDGAAGQQRDVSQTRSAIGGAVWLLLALQDRVASDRFTVMGGNPVRAKDLAGILGVSERQARRDLSRLRIAGIVQLRNTGRGYTIRLIGRGTA